MTHWFRSFVVAGLALVAFRPAAAFPVPEVPLWSLIEFSDRIVVAEVRQADWTAQARAADGPFEGDSHLAVLKVLESLKGDGPEILEIPYAGNMLCPTPPRFSPGWTVVAFLRWRDGKLKAYGGKEATLYLQGEALEDLKVLMRSAIAIQTSGAEGAELARQKRHWLVEAAVRPGTRASAIRALWPEPNGLRAVYGMDPAPEFDHLELADQKLLAEAFLAMKEPDPSMPQLLLLLEGYADPRLDAAAAAWLDHLLALSNRPWWTSEMAVRVKARLGKNPPGTVQGPRTR